MFVRRDWPWSPHSPQTFQNGGGCLCSANAVRWTLRSPNVGNGRAFLVKRGGRVRRTQCSLNIVFAERWWPLNKTFSFEKNGWCSANTMFNERCVRRTRAMQTSIFSGSTRASTRIAHDLKQKPFGRGAGVFGERSVRWTLRSLNAGVAWISKASLLSLCKIRVLLGGGVFGERNVRWTLWAQMQDFFFAEHRIWLEGATLGGGGSTNAMCTNSSNHEIDLKSMLFLNCLSKDMTTNER